MLAEEARIDRQMELILVAIDLKEHAGLVLTENEVDAARSLEDLARAVAGQLPSTTDREARATELVAAAARRAAPRLLG